MNNLMIIERMNYRDDSSEVVYCGKEIDLSELPKIMGRDKQELRDETNAFYHVTRIGLDGLVIGEEITNKGLYFYQRFGPYGCLGVNEKPFSIPFDENVRKSLVDFLNGLDLS